MLQSVKALRNVVVQATDGIAGHVAQLLVDDITWTIRHLVIHTGGWLKNRQVLLSPSAVNWHSPASRTLYLARTCQEVIECPPLETDPPVSQQHLMRALAQSIPPLYSCEPGMSASYAYITMLAGDPLELHDAWDTHLQSADSFLGAAVAARDATFGQIDDLLLDDTTWRIRHVVVKTRVWSGKRVVIEPWTVRNLSWVDSLAVVDMWRADIEQSPTIASLLHQKMPTEIVSYGWHLRW
jgi:hypothetical protein